MNNPLEILAGMANKPAEDILKDKYLILEKLSDDMFGGQHPNGIFVGSTEIQGFNSHGIKIGEQLYLYRNSIIRPSSWTSKVESFNPETMMLKTKNSTYKVHIKEENEQAS